MSTPNVPFELPTSPPPPINWATKPKQTTATVTIDGRRLCIIIDLADFDQPGLRLANNPNHSLPVRQELNMLNLNQLKEELVSQGGTRRTHDIPSHLSRSSEDLSSNLSHLSVTATSFSQRSLAPTASPTNRKKKYYVVTVGKCAGVFFNYWDNIKPLIEYVSGARYQSYSTRSEAMAAYKESKDLGLVRIVRNPGDDEKYGPMFYALP